MKFKGLTVKIIVALVLGITIGSIFNFYEGAKFVSFTDQYIFNVIGQVFLNLIFMLVVPVVFVSIVLGVIGVGDPKLLGGIGLKTLAFFLTTTALAITLAMCLALIVRPGAGHSDLLKSKEVTAYQKKLEGQKSAADSPVNQTFDQTVINFFPKNPLEAMSGGNMLQIITFAIFIGIGIMMVGKKDESYINFLSNLIMC